MRIFAPALLVVSLASCAPSQAGKCPSPRPAVTPTPPQPASIPRREKLSGLRLTVTPRPREPAHVEVALEAEGVAWTDFTFGAAKDGSLDGLVARDDRGALGAAFVPSATGLGIHLARRPEGRFFLGFRARATKDPMAPLGALVVADDRFRGQGAAFVPVPVGGEDAALEATVTVDGTEITAPHAISSLGLGTSRSRKITPRALGKSMFVAGSLGTAVMLEPSGERDEIAWLGYTSFDPRPAAAEIAAVRSALRETWKGGGENVFSLAFVSTSRPIGSFNVASLPASALVHLGPSEPWSPRMRVAITQSVQRPWFGGELHVEKGPGREGEALWFHEGVARFFAVRTLSRLGLLSPGDAAVWVNGLLADSALSPYRGKPRDEVAAHRDDPQAFSALAGQGALHALHVLAAFTKKPAGGAGLDAQLVAQMKARRDRPPPRAAFDEQSWTELLRTSVGEAEAKDFAATVLGGGEANLPEDLLGPCFRASTAKVSTRELGFDLDATLDGATRALARFDPRGPAAAAGAREGDRLVEVAYLKSNVALTLLRDGKETKLTYAPKTRTATARAFVRIAGKSDDACGLMLGR
jgi:hypothetical protein